MAHALSNTDRSNGRRQTPSPGICSGCGEEDAMLEADGRCQECREREASEAAPTVAELVALAKTGAAWFFTDDAALRDMRSILASEHQPCRLHVYADGDVCARGSTHDEKRRERDDQPVLFADLTPENASSQDALEGALLGSKVDYEEQPNAWRAFLAGAADGDERRRGVRADARAGP